MKRVAITGVGVLSAAGNWDDSWRSCRDATQVLRTPSAARDESTARLLVAEVAAGMVEPHIDAKQRAMLDPVSQYAVICAREAVAMSGVDLAGADPDRVRCVVGSGTGGEMTHDAASRQVYDSGIARLHPMTVPKIMMSAVASQVAMDVKIFGGTYAVSSACASASHAIGQAFHDIRFGQADIVIAGGSEACLSYGCIKGWQALHVLSDDLCRPFSAGRRGLVLGEGAAMFVLEEWDAARARGAPILAEVVGFGMSSDARSITTPDREGMARAMRGALAAGSISADAIDHVNAHGTGTQANDETEYQALLSVLGDRVARVPVTANKSTLGHALGASGALELAMAVRSLIDQVIPPTANFTRPDPGCPVDCVPNMARDARVTTIMSNSFAFGGLNASLVVARA